MLLSLKILLDHQSHIFLSNWCRYILFSTLSLSGNSGNAEMNNGAKHSAVDDLVAKNNKATANKELLQRGNGLEDFFLFSSILLYHVSKLAFVKVI